MKLKKITPLFFLMLFIPTTVFAGGSSVGVYETDMKHSFLYAGQDQQRIMGFTVEPWEFIPGDLTFTKFGVQCLGLKGASRVSLSQSGKQLSSALFKTDLEGGVKADFGTIDYLIPNGVATEFELLIDVEKNSGDSTGTCHIYDLEFTNLESGIEYQSNRMDEKFYTNRMIYINDPLFDTVSENIEIFNHTSLDQPLEIDSQDNQVLEFILTAKDRTKINNISINCSNSGILKNFELRVMNKYYSPIDPDGGNFDGTRPEHITDKQLMFSEFDNVLVGGGYNIAFALYADTYNYFTLPEGQFPICEISNINAVDEEAIKQLELLELERNYNYLKLRKEIACRDNAFDDARCFWNRVALIYAKQMLGKTDIPDTLSAEDYSRIDQKIVFLKNRHQQFCSEATEPATFCSALGKLINYGQYFIDTQN